MGDIFSTPSELIEVIESATELTPNQKYIVVMQHLWRCEMSGGNLLNGSQPTNSNAVPVLCVAVTGLFNIKRYYMFIPWVLLTAATLVCDAYFAINYGMEAKDSDVSILAHYTGCYRVLGLLLLSMLLVSRSMHCSPNIISVIKSRRLRWASHVANMEESRSSFKF